MRAYKFYVRHGPLFKIAAPSPALPKPIQLLLRRHHDLWICILGLEGTLVPIYMQHKYTDMWMERHTNGILKTTYSYSGGRKYVNMIKSPDQILSWSQYFLTYTMYMRQHKHLLFPLFHTIYMSQCSTTHRMQPRSGDSELLILSL